MRVSIKLISRYFSKSKVGNIKSVVNIFFWILVKGNEHQIKSILNDTEQTVMKRQLEEVCAELEKRDEKIKMLESKNIELQETQSKLMYVNLL